MKSLIRSLAITTLITIFGILPLSTHIAQASSSLAFQGFETNTGDWTPTTTRVPSGGGVLGVSSASGNFHAELTNIYDSYFPGYGGAEFSLFGYATQPPYTGDFSQSISMYIFANWPLASPNNNGQGVWIDMSPGQPANNFGGEHNFRLTPTGTAVGISVDGQGSPIVSITTSGWYKFQMTYQKGAHPTDLVTTHMNVFDPNGNLIGTTTVVSNSPGGPLLSQDLAGPGYVWITVWENGWPAAGANDVLAIDDVRADLLTVCDGLGGALKGNLTISSGQTCLLNGSTVSGNVTQTGGSLTANGSTITGNLQTTGGGTLSINASNVNGDLQVQNIPSSAGPSQICGTVVGGNLEVHNNGASVEIGSSSPPPCAGNTVGGNLQVQNNTGAEPIVGNTVAGNLQAQNNTGPTQVFNNNVTKTLQCQGNSQLLVAGPNTAAQKQGQCF